MGDNRYELVGKRVYGHASESIPFWEGASLEWAKQYALDRVKLFVVGGDGANWIHRGAEEFGNAVFQLDGFHLFAPVAEATEIGPAIYDAIRSGELLPAGPVDPWLRENDLQRGMSWTIRGAKSDPSERRVTQLYHCVCSTRVERTPQLPVSNSCRLLDVRDFLIVFEGGADNYSIERLPARPNSDARSRSFSQVASST